MDWDIKARQAGEKMARLLIEAGYDTSDIAISLASTTCSETPLTAIRTS
jgi:hypothetical protein